MELNALIKMAKESGFTHASPLDVKTLKFLPEVRAMCSADKCHSYNKCWTCPPGAGTLDEISLRCAQYSSGILVQTVGQQDDEYDFEAISDTQKTHERNFRTLTTIYAGLGIDVLPMGAGACNLCGACTWPESPCKHPELAYPSMEACGLFVSQVCTENGLKYYYGPTSISFTSCYLFK